MPASPGSSTSPASPTSPVQRILCVCTGNTCRSPMLATLLRQALVQAGRKDLVVDSAGTAAGPGDHASPEAASAMARRGLDLAPHRSRNVLDLDLSTYDQVWCMTGNHSAFMRAHGVPAAKLNVVAVERGGVPDPFGGGLAEYEACALVLEDAARRIAERVGKR